MTAAVHLVARNLPFAFTSTIQTISRERIRSFTNRIVTASAGECITYPNVTQSPGIDLDGDPAATNYTFTNGAPSRIPSPSLKQSIVSVGRPTYTEESRLLGTQTALQSFAARAVSGCGCIKRKERRTSPLSTCVLSPSVKSVTHHMIIGRSTTS